MKKIQGNPDVLAQLLVIPVLMEAVPSEENMAGFLAGTLENIPGAEKTIICLQGSIYPPQSDTFFNVNSKPDTVDERSSCIVSEKIKSDVSWKIFTVETPRHHFGNIVFKVEDGELFLPYEPHLHNIANQIALILENRLVFMKLKKMNEQLENRVEERTIKLKDEIEQRKKLEFEVLKNEKRFKLLTETIQDVFWITTWDMDKMLYISPAYELIWEKSIESLYNSPKSFLESIYPEDLNGFLEVIDKYHRQGKPFVYEYRLVRKNGEIRWLRVRGFSVSYLFEGEKVMAGVCTDITESKLNQEQIKLFASVIANAREGIIITGPEGDIIEVNDAFTQITGYDRKDVHGKNPRFLKSGYHDIVFYKAMWDDLLEKGRWFGEIWNRRKNGQVYPEMLTISTVHNAQGGIKHFVGIFSDITTQKSHQLELEHIAHYDALTNLPNRGLFVEKLGQSMIQVSRHRQKLGVVYIDLDGFKTINDKYGHETGDQLIVYLSGRMKEVMREGDYIARIGGDEFVIVLMDLPENQANIPILNRLLSAVSQPAFISDHVMKVSASLGVTFFPQADEIQAEHLLRQADQAMYQAKLAGKNRYHIFDPEQDRHVRGYHEAIDSIRLGIERHEFTLYYQPKVNMRTGQVTGAEALIRWIHPEKGLLSPAEFLPYIEDHQLIVELGEWVIDHVLSQLEYWKATGLNIQVSINISARQLQEPDFIHRLGQLLNRHRNISARNIELEILETVALGDIDHVSEIIKTSREMGINFALDDFGTGYSSLTYLRRLPASTLKIDKSFVHDMVDDPDDLSILVGITGLASAFRCQLIAEGVESLEQGKLLLQLGCELAQGYAIAAPMPAEKFMQWVESWKPVSNWEGQKSINREDLSVLMASVEHRSWVRKIHNFMELKSGEPPQLDQSKCNMGIWISSDGFHKYGKNLIFRNIESIHNDIHNKVNEIIHKDIHGKEDEAKLMLPQIDDLSRQLLEEIDSLLNVK